MSSEPIDPESEDESDSVFLEGEEIDLSKIRGALDDLRARTERTRPVSRTGIVRAVLPQLEAALKAGADYATVLGVLKEHGVEMTQASFETILMRARKQAKGLK